MNNKGFAVSGIIYSVLVLFLILVLGLLSLNGGRKVVLDRLKNDALDYINGEVRNNDYGIGITSLKVKSIIGNALETRSSEYTKDKVIMYVSLPSNSSITYDVEIYNETSYIYDILSIAFDASSGITAATTLEALDSIEASSIHKFTITLSNNSNITKSGMVACRYSYGEHLLEHVVAEYNQTRTNEFRVPYTGIYQLEVWGSEGNVSSMGGIAGTGGYATGYIKASEGEMLYITLGSSKGFNGGNNGNMSGGGATHIAITDRGELKNFIDNTEDILIVAGGGGSAERFQGGHGGGYIGGTASALTEFGGGSNCAIASGGSQISGGIGAEGSKYPFNGNKDGSFGFGGTGKSDVNPATGIIDGACSGGGGFFGGGGVTYCGGSGGGSGYIANTRLYNKHMACINCETSDEESIKTIETTCSSDTAKSDCAKLGSGYARITFISRSID